MMNLGQRTVAALMALSLITAAGCGGTPPKVDRDAGPAPLAGDLLLNRVGSGTITAHPNDIITLRTLLVDSKGTKNPDGTLSPKAIVGADVKWKFLEQTGTLSADHLATDENGLAQITVKIPSNITGEVKLRALSDGAKSTAVWTIAVQPVIKHIRIIPNAPIITLTDIATANEAAVSGAVGGVIPLQLQVTANTGPSNTDVPLPNEVVTFQFVTLITGASFTDMSRTATTSVQGTAAMGLNLGTTTGSYKVIATITGNITATFVVNVTIHPPPCHLSSQCGAGWICVGGECQQDHGGTGGSCGTSDQMCPIGYSCQEGKCTPLGTPTCDAATMCPIGYSCDSGTCTPDDPQCSATMECPSGSECHNGVCYPTDGSILNVTGHWYTMHTFDIHSALPGFLQTLGDAVSFIDQLLLGQLPGIPSFLNVFIRGIVQAYIPPWVTTVVYLLDNIFTVFSDLRAKGEMDLTAVGGPAVLYGTESWDSFVFYLLSQCGQNIGRLDPNHPPPCAEVDVYTADLAQANFATTVDPFTARLTPVTNQLLVDRRVVHLKLAGIIQYVLNQVISTTTGYPSLQGPPGHPEQGALYNLVDCAGIAQIVTDSGIPFDITGICQALVAAAADAIAQQLSNIVINADALTFNGHATAIAQPGSTTYAYRLGQVTFETIQPADGYWNANFVGLVDNVPGRWHARRQPWVQ